MIFPVTEDDELEIVEDEDIESEVIREYEIDFNTMRLTGRVVEGVDALKVWAFLALNTPANRDYIYPPEYGHTLEDLIGQPYTRDYITSQMEERIVDCLTQNPHITGVADFETEFTGSTVTATFTMETDIGDTEGEVILDV